MAHAGFAVKNGSQQAKQNTRDAIANTVDFSTSGALKAETGYDGIYRVYSYAAVIATCDRYGVWTMATRKYSRTTTSHQAAVNQAFYQNEIKPVLVEEISR